MSNLPSANLPKRENAFVKNSPIYPLMGKELGRKRAEKTERQFRVFGVFCGQNTIQIDCG